MFGLFKPRCPLDVREKTWIELRMRWLVERLGFDRICAMEVITPSDEHFPEAYTGCDDDIERIFAFVCRQMDVPRETVDLALFEGEERPRFLDDGRSSPVGLYQSPGDNAVRQTVWIKRSQCADPLHLIATAAHELAHCILLGNGLLTSAEADHEFVTDLLMVTRGLGIFAINTIIGTTRQYNKTRTPRRSSESPTAATAIGTHTKNNSDSRPCIRDFRLS